MLPPARAAVPAAAPASPAAPFRDPDTIYLQADEFINDEENGRYIARGNVEAYTRGRVVRADEIEYYPEGERLVARGGITIIEPDGAIEYADSADMTNGLEEAVALDFSIRMANGARITAAYLERSEGTQNLLTRATYSPCPVCEDDPTPTWRIRARKALQDTEDQMIYYRDVTFQIAGIPILYSPFFAHADPSVDRKSGPLLPTIGFSTLTGFEYEQPVFWAVDDHQDLTFTPRIMSDVSPLLGLNYRRRFHSGYVEFDATATKEYRFSSTDMEIGSRTWRGSLLGGGVFALDEDWSWGFGVERITDPEYLIRYGIYQANQNGLYAGDGRALLNQLFVAGQDEDFYASAATVEFQSIYLGPDERLPRLLPTAEYRHTFDLNEFGRLETVGDLAYLQRDDGVEYMRATVWGDWNRRFITSPGVVVSTLGRVRGDIYRIGDAFDPVTQAEKDGATSRLSAYSAVDMAWPFYRPGPIGLTIEPRAQVVASAGDNYALGNFASGFVGTEPVPVLEDSLIAELNAANLFAPDKYPGLDLIEEGLRANVGVTARADWRGSQASLTLGQSFRSDPETFAASSGLADGSSDYIAEGEISSGPVSAQASLRVDPEDWTVQRFDVSGTVALGPLSMQGSYVNFAQAVTGYGEREYISVFAELMLTENIAVGASFGRDLKLSQTQARSLQVTYRDDCFRITAAFIEQNYPGTTIGESTAITLTFSLATLGDFGTDTRNVIAPVY